MKESLITYVQNQLAQAEHRLRGHVTDPAGNTYPRRHIYVRLEKHLTDFLAGHTEQRWLIVPGLRGVGKTTVLSQLFLTLLGKHDSFRILYISLDEVTGLLNATLKDVLDAYESILGQSFERLTTPVFLFIDEVQYDPKWGLALKSLYDRSKKIFICCTGSSAVSLQTNPDVYRRVLWEKLYPLSFPEYQILYRNVFPPKGLKQQCKQALYFSATAQEAYQQLQQLEPAVRQYWSRVDKMDLQHYLMYGTLPFALQYTNVSQIYEAISGLLDKIILKDIESLKSFDTSTLQAIKRLLFLMADATDALALRTLPNLLGVDAVSTVQRMLQVLEHAEVLIRIMPQGSQHSKVAKPSKYCFISPAIRMALLGLVGKQATYHMRLGKLLEDCAALHLYREFVSSGHGSLTYGAAKGQADFIVQIANQRQLAIEVGIGQKDHRQVLNTLRDTACEYGIVIDDGALARSERERILHVPLQWYLMM
ncbi:MAG: ATP-binding protein [Deltaproteobacteria bacterium]|nr:ATP-binding protein [Deltaproteobacteria bacterium]